MARGGGRTAGGRVTLVAALITTSAAGVSLRDPAGVSLQRFTIAAALIAVLVGLDIAFRSGRARWTPARVATVIGALVSFYVTYLAYRNLKSVVPLLRPDELFDRRLADLDRSLFVGQRPRRAAAQRARQRDLRARAVVRLRAVLRVHPGRARVRARRPAGPAARASSSRPPSRSTGRWPPASYFLLPSLGPDLRRAGRASRISPHRRQRAAGGAARRAGRVPARPVGGGHARRASAPSPRCTSRSSSPRRWRPTCSGSADT